MDDDRPIGTGTVVNVDPPHWDCPNASLSNGAVLPGQFASPAKESKTSNRHLIKSSNKKLQVKESSDQGQDTPSRTAEVYANGTTLCSLEERDAASTTEKDSEVDSVPQKSAYDKEDSGRALGGDGTALGEDPSVSTRRSTPGGTKLRHQKQPQETVPNEKRGPGARGRRGRPRPKSVVFADPAGGREVVRDRPEGATEGEGRGHGQCVPLPHAVQTSDSEDVSAAGEREGRHLQRRTSRLDPQGGEQSPPHSRLDPPHSRLDLPHSRLDLPHSRLDLPHSRLDLPHSRLDRQLARRRQGGAADREEQAPIPRHDVVAMLDVRMRALHYMVARLYPEETLEAKQQLYPRRFRRSDKLNRRWREAGERLALQDLLVRLVAARRLRDRKQVKLPPVGTANCQEHSEGKKAPAAKDDAASKQNAKSKTAGRNTAAKKPLGKSQATTSAAKADKPASKALSREPETTTDNSLPFNKSTALSPSRKTTHWKTDPSLDKGDVSPNYESSMSARTHAEIDSSVSTNGNSLGSCDLDLSRASSGKWTYMSTPSAIQRERDASDMRRRDNRALRSHSFSCLRLPSCNHCEKDCEWTHYFVSMSKQIRATKRMAYLREHSPKIVAQLYIEGLIPAHSFDKRILSCSPRQLRQPSKETSHSVPSRESSPVYDSKLSVLSPWKEREESKDSAHLVSREKCGSKVSRPLTASCLVEKQQSDFPCEDRSRHCGSASFMIDLRQEQKHFLPDLDTAQPPDSPPSVSLDPPSPSALSEIDTEAMTAAGSPTGTGNEDRKAARDRVSSNEENHSAERAESVREAEPGFESEPAGSPHSLGLFPNRSVPSSSQAQRSRFGVSKRAQSGRPTVSEKMKQRMGEVQLMYGSLWIEKMRERFRKRTEAYSEQKQANGY